MRLSDRKQVEGLRFVLAIDGQLKNMLRKLRVVCWHFDLVLISERTLKFLVLGFGAGWTLDAVVSKSVAVCCHGCADPMYAGLLAQLSGRWQSSTY